MCSIPCCSPPARCCRSSIRSAARRSSSPRRATSRAAEHDDLARRVAINCFVLLIVSTFIGAYVLDFFGLSIPAVQVAGGAVVCAMGWNLLSEPDRPPSHARDAVARQYARRPRAPGVLSADDAAHRRPRLDLRRDHARREPGARRPHADRDVDCARRRHPDRRVRRVPVLSLRGPAAAATGRRRDRHRLAPDRRSSCCASACKSCGTGSRAWSRRCTRFASGAAPGPQVRQWTGFQPAIDTGPRRLGTGPLKLLE